MTWVARQHDAACIFSKQHKLRGKFVRRQVHSSTHAFRKRLLRQRHRQSAIRAVMRGFRQALLNQFD